MAELTEKQANRIFEAETFEEKKRLALEAGLSEEEINSALGRGTIQRLGQRGSEGSNAVSQPAPDLTPEPQEIPFDEEDVPVTATGDTEDTDTPVDYENSVSDLSQPVEKDLENLQLVQSAVIQNYLDGTPLTLAYMQQRGIRDKKNLRDTFVDIKRHEDMKAVRQLFLDQPGVTPDEIETEAQINQLMQMQVQEEMSGPQGKANAYADALAQGRIDEAAQMQLATNAMLYESVVRPLAEDVDWWDTTKQLFWDVLPGSQNWDNINLTGLPFNAQTKLQDAVARFQTMSPEEKQAVFPELKKRLVEEVGSTQAVGILSQFLDPVGEMGFDEFSNAWAAVDLADAATLWGGLATSVLKAGKQAKIIDGLKTAERTDEAADISAASAVDETGETAAGAGISRETAHNNALPFRVEGIDPEYTSGLSGKIQKRLEAFRLKTRQTTEEIAAGRSWVREEAPLSAEQAERLALDRIRSRENIENAEIVNRTEEGFDLRYEVLDNDGNLIRRERFPVRYNPEADSAWDLPKQGAVRMYLESNTSLAGQSNMKVDADKALRLDTSTPLVANKLMELQREAVEPILGGVVSRPGRNPFLGARKQLAELDEVLRQGNKDGVRFTSVELRAKGLSDAQIEAYNNLREVFDRLHELRNMEIRRDLVKQGYKNVTLSNGDSALGQPYVDAAAANRSLAQIQGPREFARVDDSGDVVRLSEVDMEDMYNQGYELVRLQEGVPTEEAGKVFFSFARRDQIGDVPEQVIHYREGYVPRVYPKGAYFVKSVQPTRVDGAEIDLSQPKLAITRGADTQTLRMFDNRKEAEEFAQKMEAELDPNSKERFVVLEDREIESQGLGIAGERGAGPSGGLYTGARADQPIPFGPEGVEAETLSAFEALTRNVQNISNFITRNEMRQFWQQKWIKTANELGVRAQRFGDIPAGTNKETAAFLKKTRQAIDDWSAIPSDSERWWEAASQKMIDKAAGTRFDWAKGTLHNFKHKDPVAAARSATFHSLLGWFNPVQLWVQAQGATVALSMNLTRPDRMARILTEVQGLAAVDFVDNFEVLRRAAEAVDVTPNRLKKIKALWDRTGYKESILNTADHAAAIQSYGVGADSMRRVANKGLFVYRMGELFNRRVSFLTALDERLRTTGKTLDAVTDDDLRQIMTKANDYMLNLTRGNRAHWQRGVLGLATQFQQVNTKMLETLLGSNGRFSRYERGKILAGQFGLYGFAGLPFLTLGAQGIAGLAGVSEDEMINAPDEVKRALNGGLTDFLAMEMFGADVDVANRSAIADGIETFIFDFFEDPANAVFALPFTSVADRAYSAFRHAWVLGGPALKEGEIPPGEVFAGIARETAKITSSWSNVEKAIHMRRHSQLLSKGGNALVEKDFNTATEIAAALGFSPKEVNLTYELEAINRANKKYVSGVASEVVFLMSQYAKAADGKAWDEVDPEVRDYYTKAIRSRYALMRNEREEETLRRSVARRIQTGNARYDRAVREYVKNLGDDGAARLSEKFAQMKGRPIQIYLEEEE